MYRPQYGGHDIGAGGLISLAFPSMRGLSTPLRAPWLLDMPGRITFNDKENEMPKLKTHSGAKKRFRVTGKGKVKAGASHRRHFMRRRSQNHQTHIASGPDPVQNRRR